MSVGVVIVAAGRGERAGGTRPKQFADLGGRSMLRRSVDAFDAHPAIAELVVVLPSDRIDDAEALVGPTRRPTRAIAGGERRQDSVRLGVAGLSAGVEIVLVHDAARPFADAALIDRVIAGARASGAVVPAVPAKDTIKRVPAGAATVRETIPREEVWLAQTPQAFQRAVLDAALAAGAHGAAAVTDEAMLAERAGYDVTVVPGDPANVKITTADDLAAAQARLAGHSRVGAGYDLHRLVEGRPLVLAGVLIPSPRGPEAHSDGDVVCHAIVDAVLGAAAAGDIGAHFPNTDPRWKDAPGLDLLARTSAIVGEGGWRAANIDVTVVLERPKLAPHIDGIRAAIAGCLALSPDRVSVKAKTNEGVDAVGRGEAIAAHAVALLERAATA
jgi:2-C-methyl-D-erythritol 4-phosphate cytidylyltransferase/2-C-methyl-D-erythritol 2,4-cyclodiphosphate synthase